MSNSGISSPPYQTLGLVGHDRAELALHDAWRGGRLPHAWLITGPSGIGKATLAYRFARTVLDAGEGGGLFGNSATGWEFPPEHLVSRQIAERAHPDLFVLERTAPDHIMKSGTAPRPDQIREQIAVDDARALSGFFAHTAAANGWRVAIVDSADALNSSSANALLKVIEEPPERALILLIAHQPALVLPTIRSRCRSLRLQRLSDNEVTQVLNQQWPELPPELETGLIALSDGRPGRALELGEADGHSLYVDLVSIMLQLPDKMDVPSIHNLADRLARRDTQPLFRTLVSLPLWWLSRLISTGVGLPPAQEPVPREAESIARVMPMRNLEQWATLWEKLSQFIARGALSNLDRKQISLNVLTTLGQAARGLPNVD